MENELQAVCTAVDECIQEGILRDFLQEQKAEAIAMSIFEYNAEEELKKLRVAEREGGFEDGFAAGENHGRLEGKTEGISIGKTEGISIGRTEGAAEAVLTVLEEIGDIPKELRIRITEEEDVVKLKSWLKKAARAESIEAFLKEISDETGV